MPPSAPQGYPIMQVQPLPGASSGADAYFVDQNQRKVKKYGKCI